MATQYNIKPGTKVGSLIKKKTTDTKSKSSSRSSSKKITVVYDSTGKVTQSNDPNRPVGMVDTSKAKESVTKDIKADDTPTSTVFQRKGGRITKQTFQEGGMVSSEVVQTKDTPKGQRKTTSQLAREQQIISQIQKRKAFEQKETERLKREEDKIKEFYKPKTEKLYSEVPITIKDLQKSGFLEQSIKPEAEEQVLAQYTYGLKGVGRKSAINEKKFRDSIPFQSSVVSSKDTKTVQKFQTALAERPLPLPTEKFEGAFSPSQQKKPLYQKVGRYLSNVGQGLAIAQYSSFLRPNQAEIKYIEGKPVLVPIKKKESEITSFYNKIGELIPKTTYQKQVSNLLSSVDVTQIDPLTGKVNIYKDPRVLSAGLFTATGLIPLLPKSIIAPIAMSLTAGYGTVKAAEGIRFLRSDKESLKVLESKSDLITQAYKEALSITKAQTKENLFKETTKATSVDGEGKIIVDVSKPLSQRIKDTSDFLYSRTFFAKKDIFAEKLREKGFEGSVEDAYQFARSQKVISFGGELASLLAAGATTEKIGRLALKDIGKLGAKTKFLKKDVRLIKQQAKKSLSLIREGKGDQVLKQISKLSKERAKLIPSTLRKQKLRKEVFKTIAPLGFAEGFAESLSSDISRRPNLSLQQKLTRATITGVIAAPLAGVIGAEIAVAKGARKKVISLGANIADITEKPGDIIADVSTSLIKIPSKVKAIPSKVSDRFISSIVATPAFSSSSILFTETATPSITQPSQLGIAPTQDFKTRIPSISTITPSITTKVAAPTIGRATSTIQPVTLFEAPTTPTLEPSIVPISTTVPTSVATSVPTSVATTVPTSVATSVPTSVATTVPTSVATTVPTSVATTVPTSVATTVPVTVTVPTIPTIPLIGPGVKAKKVQGYNVLVKQGGKYVQVNDKPLSYGDAVSRGGYVTDNTSAATFKLSKSKKGAEANKQPASFFTRDKFRSRIIKGKQVKQPNTFIEKNAFRIDSRGELEGITARGLLARENKRKQASALKDLNLKDITGGSKLRLQSSQKFNRAIGKAKLNKANSGTFRLKGSTFRL